MYPKNNFIDTINKIDLKSILGRRFLLIFIMIVATLCMVVLNVSASISPDLVQEELKAGECYTVTKTVDIPPIPPKADVVLAFDLTGSMGDILSTAKLKAGQIMSTLITSYPGVSFTFGVMSYMDYPHFYIPNCGPPSNYGDPGDYAYSLDQPLTNSTTAVTTAINSLSLGSGGDGPEDYTRIFYESYADSNIGWRVGAKKLLVNFADNVPHDCNLNEGVSSGTWITGGDPGRDEIMFTSDDLDLQDVLASMNSSGVSLIECHTTSDYINYWNYWTGLAGGSVLITNSSNLVDDVVNAITSELTTPKVYNLTLEVTSPEYNNWLSINPSNYTEVTTGVNVTFNETICVPIGTPPGSYTFIVSAVDGDGVDYGNQTNEITVNAPQEPSPATNNPTADAGGPYYGFVDEEIEFDGTNSKDNDENGASIVQYDWKFFDEDTWHNHLGANPNHTYDAMGEYTVTLRVTDDEGSTATDTATVYITTSNNPPTQPTLDGPTFGHKQTPLDYDVVSTDLDNDTIRYIFDWGDDTNTTTEYFTNGTTATQNHSWPTYGNYLITVYAEDINNAISATTTYTVLIDVHLIDDEIKGDLIDPDSDDTWEVFYNDATGNQTDVKKENDNYLIDSDGDGKWDHVYNLVEGLSTYFDYVYQKYLKIYTEANKTPGFEIISVLAMMALVLIILRRRR